MLAMKRHAIFLQVSASTENGDSTDTYYISILEELMLV